MATRACVVGVSVGVAVLLAACAGGGSSGPTPPTGIGTLPPRPTPTASPTPTEAPAPETIPPEPAAALSEQTVEGADAVARYFLDLYPYAYATGDLEEWQRLSDPDCVFCTSVVDNVTAMHRGGDYASGGAVTVHTMTAEQLTGTRFAVEGQITQDATSRHDADGLVVSAPTSPVTYDIVFALEWRQAHWRVLELDIHETDTTT